MLRLAAVLSLLATACHEQGAADGGAVYDWRSGRVSLEASTMEIDVPGQVFFAKELDLELNPWAGDDTYSTLEAGWTENGLPMSLFIYFSSDGIDWWATELRTYDGSPAGDWIYYQGELFRTPLGSPFTGNVDLSSIDPVPGQVHFRDLVLQAFRTPEACLDPQGAFVVEPIVDHIVVSVGSGFAASVRLRDLSCVPIADTGHTFAWTTDDPTVADATGAGASGGVNANTIGQTTLHVTVTRTATGDMVSVAIPVTVR